MDDPSDPEARMSVRSLAVDPQTDAWVITYANFDGPEAFRRMTPDRDEAIDAPPAPDRQTTLDIVSPDHRYRATAGRGNVAILDAASGQTITSMTPPAWFRPAARNPG